MNWTEAVNMRNKLREMGARNVHIEQVTHTPYNCKYRVFWSLKVV